MGTIKNNSTKSAALNRLIAIDKNLAAKAQAIAVQGYQLDSVCNSMLQAINQGMTTERLTGGLSAVDLAAAKAAGMTVEEYKKYSSPAAAGGTTTEGLTADDIEAAKVAGMSLSDYKRYKK